MTEEPTDYRAIFNKTLTIIVAIIFIVCLLFIVSYLNALNVINSKNCSIQTVTLINQSLVYENKTVQSFLDYPMNISEERLILKVKTEDNIHIEIRFIDEEINDELKQGEKIDIFWCDEENLSSKDIENIFNLNLNIIDSKYAGKTIMAVLPHNIENQKLLER